jgi:hypothetical protein
MRPEEGKDGASRVPARLSCFCLPRGLHHFDATREARMTTEFGFGAAGSSPPEETRGPDLLVQGEGTVYLIHAVSPAGHAWIENHIASDAPSLGDAVAVEHRFIADIVLAAIREGLEVK